jgi:hypothetical protein
MGAGDQLRLNPVARVRLGARVAALASRTIPAAFADFLSKASRASVPLPHDQDEQMATVFMIADAFDELQAAVRVEMGADDKPKSPAWRRRSST